MSEPYEELKICKGSMDLTQNSIYFSIVSGKKLGNKQTRAT